MPPRYALYFAPDPESLLWARGCCWLGRDAERGVPLSQPAPPGWPAARVQALTAQPRHYGWHATLKAPFALRVGGEPRVLSDRLAAFCALRTPFELPLLTVARLARFVALRPVASSAALRALADACVTEFDDLRAPLDPADAARRRAAGLDPGQEALLLRYGYPYVLDEFRFHLTLTGALDADTAQELLPWLTGYFADALRQPIVVAGVCLFVQPEPTAQFRLVRRFTFAS